MKKLHLVIVLSLVQIICFSQDNWSLKKDGNGVAVYTRKLNNEKYKEIRVKCVFNASVDELLKILQDVNHHKDWVYKTIKSYMLCWKSRDTLVYYSEISVPWPASNRDAVVQLTVARDSLNKNYKIEVRSFPNLIPVKSNIIRVPYSLASYNIIALPNNRISIDYILRVDPGGSLPAWLVNYTATIGPYNTFVKLKEMVEHGRS